MKDPLDIGFVPPDVRFLSTPDAMRELAITHRDHTNAIFPVFQRLMFHPRITILRKPKPISPAALDKLADRWFDTYCTYIPRGGIPKAKTTFKQTLFVRYEELTKGKGK